MGCKRVVLSRNLVEALAVLSSTTHEQSKATLTLTLKDDCDVKLCSLVKSKNVMGHNAILAISYVTSILVTAQSMIIMLLKVRLIFHRQMLFVLES